MIAAAPKLSRASTEVYSEVSSDGAVSPSTASSSHSASDDEGGRRGSGGEKTLVAGFDQGASKPQGFAPESAEASDGHEPIRALFDPKRGVLRERPYDAGLWEDLFEPFGPRLPGNLTAAFAHHAQPAADVPPPASMVHKQAAPSTTTDATAFVSV
jgi:hypothetical protein